MPEAGSRETNPRVVLVTRKTRLDELIVRHNTVEQARFVIESQGRDFSDFLEEHRCYHEQLEMVRDSVRRLALLQVVERAFLPNFVFGPEDVVVAIGQDGLVANVLKYLDGQPLIGVNPDPARWDGVLLPFASADLEELLPEVFRRSAGIREVTLARATLPDGQTLHAVNDLFLGPRSHTSARYRLEFDGRQERQSSSGVIVSTGLGSTGWFQSLMVGAQAIAAARAGEENFPPDRSYSFGWSERRLAFTVREPFPSRTTGTELVHGWLGERSSLTIESEMAENGVIFSDGLEDDFLAFNAGAHVRIGLADRRGQLVVG